ncbi:MAG: type VI secretion protein IcmF/TssM N-terminal domain-containing protein [Planctomycetota bacterium]|jgi:hypothetical protein
MLSALESLISAITSPVRQLYYFLQKVTPGSQAFGRLSLPMRWAILAFLCLSIALAASLVRLTFEEGQPWSWVKYALIGIPLVIFISVLVYWFVVFWLKEEPSRYPDIDRVMLDGFKQLDTSGISIASTPIFLVLGTDDVAGNRDMLESAGLRTPVLAPANGDGPVSIHASKDAIWIFPQTCNAISRLRGSSPRVNIPEPESSEPLSDAPHGTMAVEDMEIDPEDRERDWGSPVEREDDMPEIEGGTIQLDNIDLSPNEVKSVAIAPKKIQSQDFAETEDRLRYLCKWIKKARKNLCPINGLLTTIPFDLIESHPEQLSLAIKKDFQVLRSELEVRVANTLLITGMEDEPGFIEMTRRLGTQRITKQRIGKGADVWVSPESDRLVALAKHATAVFEDQIFELFQQDDALRNKQNARLFTLLSRMRGNFANNLARIMGEAFGFDPVKQPELSEEQFLFSGCYFAACGSERQRQAFAPSVLNKIVGELQGEIEWLRGARERDARYRIYANWMALVGLLSLIAIVAMLAYKFWPAGSSSS